MDGSNVELLQLASGFADEHGFLFRSATLDATIGRTWTFELRRLDLWIEGTTVVRDLPPELPMPPDGVPEMPIRMDESRFIIGFYKGPFGYDAEKANTIILAFRSDVAAMKDATISDVG